MTQRTVLIVGDFGDARCGVGSSLHALVADQPEVRVLDPSVGTLVDWWGACGREARAGARAVVVYPTRSTLQQPRFFLRAGIARLRLRDGFRVYLHEYRRFGRRHRPFVAALAALATDRIVVSTAAEAAALRRPCPRLAVGARMILIAPPANGATPALTSVGEAEGDPHHRIVGVFGMWRPDKRPEWIVDVLERLEGIHEVEIVGAGWRSDHLPPHLHQKYRVTLRGHVPDEELPAVLGRWSAALAPFGDGPHDGRLSLRTPLAYGIPTFTTQPQPGELTLAVDHMLIVSEPSGAISAPHLGATERLRAAEQVAAFEASAREQLRAHLLGPALSRGTRRRGRPRIGSGHDG